MSGDWEVAASRSREDTKAIMMDLDGRIFPVSARAERKEPGELITKPDDVIRFVFSDPYAGKHTCHIEIINSSGRRIGWAIKTTDDSLGVNPASGVLDPKESSRAAISCDASAFGQEDTNNDRITIEWTNTPDGAAKKFRREWFEGDGLVRSKNLPIEYLFDI